MTIKIINLLLEKTNSDELNNRAAELIQAALKENNLTKRYKLYKLHQTYKVFARELKKYE